MLIDSNVLKFGVPLLLYLSSSEFQVQSAHHNNGRFSRRRCTFCEFLPIQRQNPFSAEPESSEMTNAEAIQTPKLQLFQRINGLTVMKQLVGDSYC